MLSRIDLRGWRRHESAEYEFDPGLNFVLGPNGSGKTSLLAGLKFGLLGVSEGPAHVNLTVGHDQAMARVDLRTDKSRLSIQHSLERRGGVVEEVRREDGIDASVDDVLRDMFDADRAFISELLFLAEGDIYKYADGSRGEIVRQLERLMPLQSMEELRSQVREARRPLATLLRDERKELQSTKRELAVLDERHARLETKLLEIEAEHADAEIKAQGWRREVDLLRSWNESKARHDDWHARWLEFVRSQDDITKGPLEELEQLQLDRGVAAQQLRDARETRASVEGRAATLRAFAEILAAGTDLCPLCKQALDEAHRRSAIAEQESDIQTLQNDIARSDSVIERLQTTMDETDNRIRACQQFVATWPGELMEKPADADRAASSLAQSETDLSRLRSDLAIINREIGQVRQEISAAEESLELDKQITSAYRKDALLVTIDSTVEAFINDTYLSVLVPLGEELQRVWKSYRIESEWGLGLDSAGRICIQRGADTLPYESLSGGEKMVAIVLLRVALVTALTSADFIVLDEPLEHLDPRGRRLLISSLAGAVDRGLLKQIILSTYEESIARRLVQRGQAREIHVASALPA